MTPSRVLWDGFGVYTLHQVAAMLYLSVSQQSEKILLQQSKKFLLETGKLSG